MAVREGVSVPQPSPAAADLVLALGGLPFLDDSFHAPMLMTLSAAVRRKADPHAFADLADYLDPGNARLIFKRHARGTVHEHPWIPLSPHQSARVAETTAQIVDALPGWEPLFQLPVHYRKVTEAGIRSATSTLIPQTIYLGDTAFTTATTRPLEETLVHEHAHLWLNQLAEIGDLQHDHAPSDFVLPSGTGGKTLRGVLLAAHFAAAAVQFYHRSGRSEGPAKARTGYLIGYLGGCLDLVIGHPALTPMGEVVTAHLVGFRDRALPGVASDRSS